jgi:hypothetical protein
MGGFEMKITKVIDSDISRITVTRSLLVGALSFSVLYTNSVAAQRRTNPSVRNNTASASQFPVSNTTSVATNEDDKEAPKRRKNAGEKDGVFNKGDKYAFDDNKGSAVKIEAKVSETMMAEYAACIADYKEKQVSSYINTIPYSKKSEASYKPLLEGECVSKQNFNLTSITFDDIQFRASIYDFLYRQAYKNTASLDYSQLEPSKYTAEYSGDSESIPAVTLVQRKFGDCVVRLAPNETRDLLSQKIWSEDESTRISALSPAMGQCLTSGLQLKFSRTLLRGTLAESLYKFNQRLGASNAQLGR